VTSVDGFASTAFGGFEGRPTPCLGHVSLDVIQGGEAHVQDGCCRGPGYIKVANDGESVTSTDGTNAAVTVRSPSGGRLALVVARRDVLVGPHKPLDGYPVGEYPSPQLSFRKSGEPGGEKQMGAIGG
jgi:hypothetical protein